MTTFGPGAGQVLRQAATQLKESSVELRATAHGAVSGVVDDPSSADRWRILVDGDVRLIGGGKRRTIWVRLRTADEFMQAVDAQRRSGAIRAAGVLQRVGSRLELWAEEYEVLATS